MASRKRMQEKAADPSHLSHPAPPDRPCNACRTDETASPCVHCPLYGAYLERCGLTPTPTNRAAYEAFVARGSWTIYWRIHRLEARLVERARILAIVRRYPRAIGRLAELTRRSP